MESQKKHKLHKRLYITLRDLEYSKRFGEYLLRKELHYEEWEKRGDMLTIQSGLTSSMIIFYARPFTKSIGLPNLPKSLIKFDNTEIKFHKKIIKMRHQIYAHSDSRNFKVEPASLGHYGTTSVFGGPFFRLSKNEVVSLSKMIEKLYEEVNKMQKSLEFELSK